MSKVKKIVAALFITFLVIFLLLLVYLKLVEKNIIVGGSKDEHGCIPTAGYTFSFSRNECVRPFEHIKLISSQNPAATLGGFIVMANDNESLDLYLPNRVHELLTLESEYIYTDNSSKYKVIKEDKNVQVFDGEVLIYKSE